MKIKRMSKSLLVFPIIWLGMQQSAIGQTYRTGEIDSLRLNQKSSKSIYSTKDSGEMDSIRLNVREEEDVTDPNAIEVNALEAPVPDAKKVGEEVDKPKETELVVERDGEVVALKDSDCLLYTPHVPRDDVAYQPNVTTSGRAVTPVNLNENNVLSAEDLEKVTIALNIPVTQYIDASDFNIPLTDQAVIGIGALEVGQDGTLSLNGKTITPQAVVTCPSE